MERLDDWLRGRDVSGQLMLHGVASSGEVARVLRIDAQLRSSMLDDDREYEFRKCLGNKALSRDAAAQSGSAALPVLVAWLRAFHASHKAGWPYWQASIGGAATEVLEEADGELKAVSHAICGNTSPT